MLRTVRAYITADRRVVFEETVDVQPGAQVLVTILEEPSAMYPDHLTTATSLREERPSATALDEEPAAPRPAPFIDLSDEAQVEERGRRAMADIEAGRTRSPEEVSAHLRSRRSVKA